MELGMSAAGVLGFIFGMVALARVRKLENQLKENGVFDKELDSGS